MYNVPKVLMGILAVSKAAEIKKPEIICDDWSQVGGPALVPQKYIAPVFPMGNSTFASTNSSNMGRYFQVWFQVSSNANGTNWPFYDMSCPKPKMSADVIPTPEGANLVCSMYDATPDLATAVFQNITTMLRPDAPPTQRFPVKASVMPADGCPVQLFNGDGTVSEIFIPIPSEVSPSNS